MLEVGVVVQHRDAVQLGDGGDEQVGDADGPRHGPPGELPLHVERAVPDLLIGHEELVRRPPVAPDLLVLRW